MRYQITFPAPHPTRWLESPATDVDALAKVQWGVDTAQELYETRKIGIRKVEVHSTQENPQ